MWNKLVACYFKIGKFIFIVDSLPWTWHAICRLFFRKSTVIYLSNSHHQARPAIFGNYWFSVREALPWQSKVRIDCAACDSPKFTDCTTVQPLSTVVYRIISWQTIYICIFFFSRLDVVGGNDGSIRMFEYIHPDQIALFRPPGQTERINKIAFNPMGNKVSEYMDYCFVVQGVCDISQKIQEKEWVFLEKTCTVRHQLALKGICVMTLHSPSWWFKLRDLRL